MTVERICNRPTKGATQCEPEQGIVVAGALQRLGSARCVRLVSFPGPQQRGFALGRQAHRRACWRSS